MQSINVAVLNPLFLGTFFGTAILCVALAIAALVSRFGAGAGYLLAGSLNYFVGSILVTMICNVPLNNKLAGRHGTMCERPRRLPRRLASS